MSDTTHPEQTKPLTVAQERRFVEYGSDMVKLIQELPCGSRFYQDRKVRECPGLDTGECSHCSVLGKVMGVIR